MPLELEQRINTALGPAWFERRIHYDGMLCIAYRLEERPHILYMLYHELERKERPGVYDRSTYVPVTQRRMNCQ